MAVASVHACPACDLLQRALAPAAGGSLYCARCGECLHDGARVDLARDAALAITALVLMTIANAFPLLTLDLNGQREAATVSDGVVALWGQARYELAVLLALLALVAPALHAVAVLVRSHLLTRPHRRRAARSWALWSVRLAPWGMTEVYLFSALVAFVKLDDIAQVVVGPALWAFAAMSLLTAWTSLHAAGVWERLRDD
ncbi:MAG: paraquat-inducible protein A [Gammaproteobacteria bacterium]